MKFSMIMTVLAVSLAVATSGCRYSKAKSAGADAGDTAVGSNIATSDLSSLEGGNIGDVSEGKFEDLYTRCTDVNFAPVYFGFDSTVVPQGELVKIDDVARHLAERSNRVVVIEGNCDERGSNEYNMSLGENRSIIVRNYLVQSGIAADRIQTRSYGEEKPAVDGHDEGAWMKNRRAEFAIFQK